MDRTERSMSDGRGEHILPFELPVGLVFADDGAMYVTERLSGRVIEVKDGRQRTVCQFRVPNLQIHHETGVLGLVLDPDFDHSRAIFVYHTVQDYQEPMHNRISRVNVDTGEEEARVINLPAGQLHNGGVMVFGPDGKLYVGIGEFTMSPLAQVRDFPAGKVLRMNSDGSVPNDNPFPGSLTFSYGHRNIFGLAFHPTTGELFECDVEMDHDDEININTAGGNYGWPIVTGKAGQADFVDPIYVFKTVVTPTQCAFLNAREFLVGSYNFGQIMRLTLKAPRYNEVIRNEVVYVGRPFTIMGTFVSPAGEVYITRPDGVVKVALQTPRACDRAAA
jgi:glucose/arabinose dehydrogenase